MIGSLAAVLNVYNMFPQYLQVMKTKRTRDISRASFTSITCAASLWVLYGILKHDIVLILANVPMAFFCASILLVKLKHG